MHMYVQISNVGDWRESVQILYVCNFEMYVCMCKFEMWEIGERERVD